MASQGRSIPRATAAQILPIQGKTPHPQFHRLDFPPASKAELTWGCAAQGPSSLCQLSVHEFVFIHTYAILHPNTVLCVIYGLVLTYTPFPPTLP